MSLIDQSGRSSQGYGSNGVSDDCVRLSVLGRYGTAKFQDDVAYYLID